MRGSNDSDTKAGGSTPFAGRAASAESPQPSKRSETSSLLMRFFESEFFDAWIAVSYLHKDLPESTREYLCQRIYQLPESEVEPYVSQLCQLYVSKGGDDQVERLLIDLCANSLNIAVKTYWILLAISQDYEAGGARNGRDQTGEIVNRLKDRCEFAGLQGHWEIPFKEARLSPVSLPNRRESRSNRFMRGSVDELRAGSSGIAEYGGNGLGSRHGSTAHASFQRSRAQSFCSDLTEIIDTNGRHEVNGVNLVGDGGEIGAGVTPVAAKTDRSDAIGVKGSHHLERVSPNATSTYLSTVFAVDTGVEGLIYDDGGSGLGPGRDVHNLHMDLGVLSPLGGSSPIHTPDTGIHAVYVPSSPKRRETTFGATLDFVEALCSASSALTSVVEEERQWALQKALRNINTEIDRASRSGVAIWFPMARAAPQRVIRLAYRESRLLNSREKAPFTLYVEVLNEEMSLLEAQGVLIDSKSRPQSAELSLADIEGSLESFQMNQIGLDYDARAVAEEAAAAGIAWVSQHHRKSSSTDFTTSSVDASIALQAVKGSSAAHEAHIPLMPDDTPQLTPSIQSQRSDVSMLASSPATESRDCSPDKREGLGLAHPTISTQQPQVGGGTWIGKASKHLGQTSMSSPRIQAALDDIRGDGPVVRVRLHVDALSEGEKLSRGQAQAPTKRCTNSTVWCSFGLCRCPKIEATPQVNTPASRVRVDLVVGGGLDLSIRRPKHKRMPTQEALMHIAQQHTLSPTPTLMATIESGAEFHGNDPQNDPGNAQGQSMAANSCSRDTLEDQGRASTAVPSQTDPSRDTPKTVLAKSKTSTGDQGVPKSTTDVYGEKWIERKERIRKRSPHGTRSGWDLAAVIVKDGDDCRQELLSMQLIRTFQSIFEEAGLPLWLRPYDILVTSNLTALIEMIPNAPSIHNVKSSFSDPDMTLRSHFLGKYGHAGKRTPEFHAAQNNFVESMAAYSLLCYVLQLRDRHNGNILLDDQGHVIHIDFGFMLSNSPGGVNFESAPFKLTKELLEVMDSDSDGTSSKSFDYFKVLMIQGFIAICKHSDRIIELVSMMSESGCPCFRNKQLAVEGLRKRISTRMSEEKYVDHVLGLISEALDNWRTRQYDYYQRILNGIQ